MMQSVLASTSLLLLLHSLLTELPHTTLRHYFLPSSAAWAYGPEIET